MRLWRIFVSDWLEDFLLFLVCFGVEHVLRWVTGRDVTGRDVNALFLPTGASHDPPRSPLYGGLLILCVLAALPVAMDVRTPTKLRPEQRRFHHAAGPLTMIGSFIFVMGAFAHLGAPLTFAPWAVLLLYVAYMIGAVWANTAGKPPLPRTARRVLMAPLVIVGGEFLVNTVHAWLHFFHSWILLAASIGASAPLFLMFVAGPRMLADDDRRPFWVWAIRYGLFVAATAMGLPSNA